MAQVDVMWGDAEGTPHVAPAKLEDTSHHGVSVRVRTAIPVGSHVTVKWGNEQDSGIVIYSRCERSDYIIGVKREADDGDGQK